MRRRLARVGGFLSTANGGKNLNVLRDLLERSLFGKTGNGFQNSLLVCHGIILKCQAVFARETFSQLKVRHSELVEGNYILGALKLPWLGESKVVRL